MKKMGDIIIIKSEISPDGKFECRVNNIDRGYIHAYVINLDGSSSSVEIVIPVDSEAIIK